MKKLLKSFLILIAASSFYFCEGATYLVTVTTAGDPQYSPSPSNTNCTGAGNTNTVPPTGAWIGSLAWAISSANCNPGVDNIVFNVPSGTILTVGNPNWYVFSDPAGVVLDATSGSMNSSWVAAGSCGPVVALDANGSYNFISLSNNCTIKGLAIYNFGIGITIPANTSGCYIAGCYFGLNLAGNANVLTSGGRQYGIQLLAGATGNTIGGVGCGLRNVFSSAMTQCPIYLTSSTNNYIVGNYIGTYSDGVTVNPRGAVDPSQGIYLVSGSNNNIISNNVISGFKKSNTVGFAIQISASSATGIYGNLIGVGATGTLTGHENTYGIQTSGACGKTRIGWWTAGSGNTICRSSVRGIEFGCNPADSLYLINNNIGVPSTGLSLYPTRFGNNLVTLNGGDGNVWIGESSGSGGINGLVIANNVISDAGTKTGAAASSYSSEAVGITLRYVKNVLVTGNFIGTDRSGLAQNIGNEATGLLFDNAANVSNVTIGGNSAALRNIVVNNGARRGATQVYASHGMFFNYVSIGGHTNITVLNNYFGVGSDGVTKMGNSVFGFGGFGVNNLIMQGNIASNNSIGAMFGGATNLTITGNTFQKNIGFPSATPYEGGGIIIQNGSSGPTLITNNTISNNMQGIWLRTDGSYISTSAPTLVTITGNIITYNNGPLGNRGPNPAEFGTYGNGGNGIAITSANNTNTNNYIYNNTIQNNTINGVYIYNDNRNWITQNSISCNGTGSRNGIWLDNSGTSNQNIWSPSSPGFTYPPYMTSSSGIQYPNTPSTPTGSITPSTSDILEVFYDPCGTCQGRQYLGNATISISGTTLYWSFPAASIPTLGYCSTTIPAGTCPSGLINVSATLTDVNKNTSQFWSCTPVLVLPVTYISFTGKVKGENAVQLDWVTGSEVNSNYFVVQRSTNGTDFNDIGTVKSVSNSNIALQYSFVDNSPVGGFVYYRLKQVDLNGSSNYSSIVIVQIKGYYVNIYPNPSSGSFSLQASSSDPVIINYSLFNTLGVAVSNGILNTSEGFAEDKIDISQFYPGVYTFVYSVGDTSNYKKVIVQ